MGKELSTCNYVAQDTLDKTVLTILGIYPRIPAKVSYQEYTGYKPSVPANATFQINIFSPGCALLIFIFYPLKKPHVINTPNWLLKIA